MRVESRTNKWPWLLYRKWCVRMGVVRCSEEVVIIKGQLDGRI